MYTMKYFKAIYVGNACENAYKFKSIMCLPLLGHLSGCIVLHQPTFPSIWGHGERCFTKERMTITRDNSVGETDA